MGGEQFEFIEATEKDKGVAPQADC